MTKREQEILKEAQERWNQSNPHFEEQWNAQQRAKNQKSIAVPKPAPVPKKNLTPADCVCPRCSSPDTQSFPMAYKSGTRNISGVGAGVSLDGDIGVGGMEGQSQSLVASSVAPPQPKSFFWRFVGAWYLTAIVYAQFAYAFDTTWKAEAVGAGLIYGWWIMVADLIEYHRSEFWPTVCRFLFPIIAVWWGVLWARSAAKWNRLFHAPRYTEWEAKWLCRRCGWQWMP